MEGNPLKVYRRISQLQTNFLPLEKRCMEAHAKKIVRAPSCRCACVCCLLARMDLM